MVYLSWSLASYYTGSGQVQTDLGEDLSLTVNKYLTVLHLKDYDYDWRRQFFAMNNSFYIITSIGYMISSNKIITSKLTVTFTCSIINSFCTGFMITTSREIIIILACDLFIIITTIKEIITALIFINISSNKKITSTTLNMILTTNDFVEYTVHYAINFSFNKLFIR